MRLSLPAFHPEDAEPDPSPLQLTRQSTLTSRNSGSCLLILPRMVRAPVSFLSLACQHGTTLCASTSWKGTLMASAICVRGQSEHVNPHANQEQDAETRSVMLLHITAFETTLRLDRIWPQIVESWPIIMCDPYSYPDP